jgi:hypothetical protein
LGAFGRVLQLLPMLELYRAICALPGSLRSLTYKNAPAAVGKCIRELRPVCRRLLPVGGSLQPENLDTHLTRHPAADIVSWIQSICQVFFGAILEFARTGAVTTAAYSAPARVLTQRLLAKNVTRPSDFVKMMARGTWTDVEDIISDIVYLVIGKDIDSTLGRSDLCYEIM